METDNKDSRHEGFKATRRGRSFAGLILVLVGGVLLSRQLGLDVPEWTITWEMLLITLGVYFGARRSFQPGGWLVLVLVGTVFLLKDYYPEVLIWNYIWPMAFILVGLWMILIRCFPFCPRRTRTTGASTWTPGPLIKRWHSYSCSSS